jgi:hypothetical protein
MWAGEWNESGTEPAMPNQTRAMFAALPPGFLMWASMYAPLFCICSGMLAAMYSRD